MSDSLTSSLKDSRYSLIKVPMIKTFYFLQNLKTRQTWNLRKKQNKLNHTKIIQMMECHQRRLHLS